MRWSAMVCSCGCALLRTLWVVLIFLSASALSDPVEAPKVLKVGVVKADGFCTPKLHPSGSTPSPDASNWEGFMPEVISELGKMVPFVPKFELVPDGKYGTYNTETKTWSGVIGEIVNHRIDIGGAPMTVSALREEHVDFTHEILDVGLVVMVKRPERLSLILPGSGFFFGVFDSGVWSSVLAAFLVTSFLLHLNDRYNPRENRAKMVEHIAAASSATGSPLNQFTLLGSAFFVLSTGCFQGYQRAPRSLCGRCLSLCWWVFACLLAATYTAGFLCSLVATGSRQDNTFSYLDARDQYQTDRALMQAMVPLWLPGGSTAALMRNSTDSLFQMFNKLHEAAAKEDERVANLKNMSQLADLLTKGSHFIGIVESPLADYYVKQSHCELVVTGQFLGDRSWALALSENSTELRNKLNEAILTLRETGFIRHAYQRNVGGPFVPCGPATPSLAAAALGLAGEELARMFRDSLPITLKTFAGPVVLYFLSLLVSALAALIDLHIFANIERQHNAPQVLRSTQEPADEPNFSGVAFSDEQQRQQQQQQQEQQHRDDIN